MDDQEDKRDAALRAVLLFYEAPYWSDSIQNPTTAIHHRIAAQLVVENADQVATYLVEHMTPGTIRVACVDGTLAVLAPDGTGLRLVQA